MASSELPPAARAFFRASSVAVRKPELTRVAPVMESTLNDWASTMRGSMCSSAAFRMLGSSRIKPFSITSTESSSVSLTSILTRTGSMGSKPAPSPT